MFDHPRQMTPMMPADNANLSDLAVDVIRKSAELSGRLHPVSRRCVVDLLRIINSYYSNLIEGHKTHPIDIEHAMQRIYFDDPEKRALQEESLIHIEVQETIERDLAKKEIKICSSEFIRSIHKRFYERMPAEFKIVNNKKTGEKVEVIPGDYRLHEVVVGQHVPPTHYAVPDFMGFFEESYEGTSLQGEQKILAAGASHHRLGWIHPFTDGNGRVMRLFTDTFMHNIPVKGYGLWTISRGFARQRDDYYKALTWGDAPRQGDYDGRGNLSLKGLTAFCRFFLETCLDQISFMGTLLRLDDMLDRIKGYIELRNKKMVPGDGPIKVEAVRLLQEALLKGEYNRGQASRITGLPERTARVILSSLVKEGLLVSDTPRGPVRLAVSAKAAPYWFPSLFPDK